MEQIVKRPSALADVASGYCPGCMHSTANKIIAEVLDEMNMVGKTIAVFPVGCAVISAAYFKTDRLIASHGRAPAVATGIKRSRPDNLVFTYQGDGDLTSIGMAETIHAANRGENVTVIFINNHIYGMTGGQMSPTTLAGAPSTTGGPARDPLKTGYPIKMCEIINQLEAPAYIGRFALNTVPNINKAKNAIRKAFDIQMNGGGYSFIELLSNCSTNWKLTPLESLRYMQEKTIPAFPLGVYRDRTQEAKNNGA